MVNPITQIVVTNETCYGKRLNIMQLCQDGALPNNLKLLRGGNLETGKFWLHQWLRFVNNLNLYQITVVCGTSSRNTHNSYSGSVNCQWQSPAQTRRDYWRYQRYTKQNQQEICEDINVWWRLYKSILSEYKYTSLSINCVARYHHGTPNSKLSNL